MLDPILHIMLKKYPKLAERMPDVLAFFNAQVGVSPNELKARFIREFKMQIPGDVRDYVNRANKSTYGKIRKNPVEIRNKRKGFHKHS